MLQNIKLSADIINDPSIFSHPVAERMGPVIEQSKYQKPSYLSCKASEYCLNCIYSSNLWAILQLLSIPVWICKFVLFRLYETAAWLILHWKHHVFDYFFYKSLLNVNIFYLFIYCTEQCCVRNVFPQSCLRIPSVYFRDHLCILICL